jgi:hypothetical protein
MQAPLNTGKAEPWTAPQDDALRAAVAEHGNHWETIRTRVEAAADAADDAYAQLLPHLGAPGSKSLRKRWDRLQTLDG